ncbi:hypothetical protein [Pseudomonas wadenswilerensis]|uniref:hypothetical protein n=1 Tax=Pseudomonas wadenswilerensis TaxID=1785161 RepID=UPI002160DA7A|nr:hypothetical protein [Pseudomonas wadenswilerensis]UVM20074.1 hypothetical protein LOY45_16610 [Pseudomonas wadenswilerensis]
MSAHDLPTPLAANDAGQDYAQLQVRFAPCLPALPKARLTANSNASWPMSR